jgi:hypothetical protein
VTAPVTATIGVRRIGLTSRRDDRGGQVPGSCVLFAQGGPKSSLCQKGSTEPNAFSRCALLDEAGEPALDADGAPLTDSTELVITYQHQDSFATDEDGQVIAARVGAATVSCSAPGLELVDAEPVDIEIVPGRRRGSHRARARDGHRRRGGRGELLGGRSFDNAVGAFEYSLSLSPGGRGHGGRGGFGHGHGDGRL